MNSLPRPVLIGVAVSLAIGFLSMGLLAFGFGNLGGVAAFVHQCFIVGLPLALVLGSRIERSARTTLALSFALSMAISALASTLLIMWSSAGPVRVVLLSTLYGIVVALVADGSLIRRTAMTLPEQPSEDDGDDDGARWRDTRELAIPRADHGAAVPAPPRLGSSDPRRAAGRFVAAPSDRDTTR